MNIKKQNQTFFLSGIIDEHTNFETEIGSVPNGCEINCQGVSKINSNGVKSWISFFSKAKAQGINFCFSNLSPVLVEQLNSLSNFCVQAPVTSLMVPFACTVCKKETIVSMDIPSLKANPEPNPIHCSHCQGRAEFDDLPEEYFCCLENLD